MSKGSPMVVAYVVLSLLCVSIGVELLWSISPVLAIALAPFIASAGVLLAGILIARHKPNAESWVGALRVDEVDRDERRAAA